MDIKIIIRKSLLYSFLVSILTIIYILFAFFLEHLFKGLIGYNSFTITFFAISLLLILFHPIKNKLQYFLDKYFFHGSIDQIDTENTLLREELQKQEKLKAVATLAAGMAHEIKNPLTAIKTFTEYLPQKKSDPEFLDKFYNTITPEIERIDATVRELLEFSKPKDLELTNTNLNELLNSTVNLLNNDLLKKNIRVETKFEDIPITKVDAQQMKQVFLNLLLNAIDAIGEDGTISITTNKGEYMDSPLRISIKDTGKGISKEDLKHIFDPFFTKKDGGTGLGLSVVHGIIEKHNGKIEVLSEVGFGTEIIITLGGL